MCLDFCDHGTLPFCVRCKACDVFLIYMITGWGYWMGNCGPRKPQSVLGWLDWSFFSCKIQVMCILVNMDYLFIIIIIIIF